MITFYPAIHSLGRIASLRIIGGPNFCGCSFRFAMENGSPTQRRILAAIDRWMTVPDGYTATVTSKTAHGLPGMVLAKPGWHWDGFEHDGMTPLFDSYDPNVRHFAGNFVADVENGPVAATEYLRGPVSLEGAYPYAELQRAAALVPSAEFGPNTLYSFDQNTVHRSGLVRRPGTRMFLRVSISKREPIDLIDTNPVQVYADLAAHSHGAR